MNLQICSDSFESPVIGADTLHELLVDFLQGLDIEEHFSDHFESLASYNFVEEEDVEDLTNVAVEDFREMLAQAIIVKEIENV